MKRIIAGGTGFIGQHLIKQWLAAQHQIIVIGRSREKISRLFNNKVEAVEWRELTSRAPELLADAQVIVNLTGSNIGAGRWTDVRKQEILQSRVEATRTLAELCAGFGEQSPPLFNANGVGIYGSQAPANNGLPSALDENTVIDHQQSTSFLAEVGRQWELATLSAREAKARVVLMRFGAVLDAKGGALQQLLVPFRLGLGGPLGTGQQAFSWIALKDLGDAIEFLISHPEVSGPVNLVAPECVTQKQFAKTLGKVLHRPAFMPTPEFLIKTIFGQMGEELLLSGQNVYPKRLLELGYKFSYPDIESALKFCIERAH